MQKLIYWAGLALLLWTGWNILESTDIRSWNNDQLAIIQNQ